MLNLFEFGQPAKFVTLSILLTEFGFSTNLTSKKHYALWYFTVDMTSSIQLMDGPAGSRACN